MVPADYLSPVVHPTDNSVTTKMLADWQIVAILAFISSPSMRDTGAWHQRCARTFSYSRIVYRYSDNKAE